MSLTQAPMRFATPILIAILFFTTISRTAAQETAADWVRKLGSSVYVERATAAQQLEKIGLASLPALRASLTSADLETRRRAVELMVRIEDLALREETIRATPTRLRFEKTPVDAAIQIVHKHTWLRIGVTNGKTPVTIDTGVVPYWQAWRAFRQAADLEEFDFAEGAQLPRRPRAEDRVFIREEGPRSAADPPLVLGGLSAPPIQFAAKKSSAAWAEDSSSSVRVRVRWVGLDETLVAKQTQGVFAIEIRPEPRLDIASFPRAEITKIVDGMGQTRAAQAPRLSPDQTNPILPAVLVHEIHFGGLLHMKPIVWQGPMTPLKELHGRVRFEVMAKPRMMEIANVLKAVGTEAIGDDGLTMTLVKAEREGSQLHLHLRFKGAQSLTPKPGEPQVVRVRPGVLGVLGPMDVAMQRIEVRDARGWRCMPLETSYEREGEGDCYLAQLMVETSAPAQDEFTLVMTKSPRRIPIEVPFVVRDLSVPALKGLKGK